MNQLVSIIIRTKNEERWIVPCLQAISQQSYTNYEIVLVDNNSTDKTVAKATAFGVKLVTIDEFKPGLAINTGIRASSGEYIVCLSGHCIPSNSDWLLKLIAGLEDPTIAGVYGRQEPLSFSSDLDKRDLMMVFGLDKKVQEKDPLFHNANSAFCRETWLRFPFNEHITNIEDRLWGQEVINAGLKILYEPSASVYHWHGIHHGQNAERAASISKILDSIHLQEKSVYANPADLSVLAIVPVKGDPTVIQGEPQLLESTISTANASKYINEVLISSDSKVALEYGTRLGANLSCQRPKALSESYIDIADVLEYTLREVENNGYTPDIVVLLEETFPFRSANLIDMMIDRLITGGYDSVVAVKPETRPIWVKKEDNFEIVTDGFMPSILKTTSSFIGIVGCCSVAFASAIREKSLFTGNVGFHQVSSPLEALEVGKNIVTDQYSLDRISAIFKNTETD